MKKKLVFLLAFFISIGLVSSCTSGDVQKIEIAESDEPFSAYSYDLKWPIGATLTYNVVATGGTKYYYLRDGEEVKELNYNNICNYGYDSANNPTGYRDYSDHECSKGDIGKAPKSIEKGLFKGEMVVKILGKEEERFTPCAHGCTFKDVNYYEEISLYGDGSDSDELFDYWYFDTSDSNWKTANESDIEYWLSLSLGIVGYHVDSSQYVVSNALLDSHVQHIGWMSAPILTFNDFKYNPWKDSAWTEGMSSSSVYVYDGKEKYDVLYNGKNMLGPDMVLQKKL